MKVNEMTPNDRPVYRAEHAVNIFAAMREIHHHVEPWRSSFHVEGRGCV